MQNSYILSLFKVATIIVIAICVVSFILTLLFIPNWTWSDVKIGFLYNAYFGYSFSIVNSVLHDLLNRKYDWNNRLKERMIYGVVFGVIVNVLLLIILLMIKVTVFDGKEFTEAFSPRMRGTYLIALMITTIVTLIFYSMAFYSNAQKSKLVNEKLKQEKVTAELNALKSQIDPHFLFNSFNVLSGLIDEDSAKAQKFLGRLSKIYRYILEKREESLTSLKEELLFADEFMFLQKARFEDSVIMKVDINEEHLESKIPSLSLQLLLENAMKHNGFESSRPLTIDIKSGDGFISVHNNKQFRNKLAKGSGMGLENIKKRYDLYETKGFLINETKDSFEVQLPLL